MKYEMALNNDKNDWVKMLVYFTNVYAMRKEYSEYHATESGQKIAANVTHTAPPESISNTFFKMIRGGTIVRITPTQEDNATAVYNDYIEGQE